MWRSSGVLYLPYIFTTRKRVYKPIVFISTKLLKMSSFCQNMACGYRERAGVDLSDIYVWRMDKYPCMPSYHACSSRVPGDIICRQNSDLVMTLSLSRNRIRRTYF